MDSTCNRYGEKAYRCKIRGEVRAMFSSLCDAPTTDDESSKEGIQSACNQRKSGFQHYYYEGGFIELHSAHVEFAKLQQKMQPNEDNGGLSLSPTLAIGKLNSKAPTSATTSMADSSFSANTEDHRDFVRMD